MAADDIDLAMNFGGRRRSRVPMVVGGVLATAVVGGIAWWALGRRGATSEAEPPTDGPPLPTDEPEPPPAAGNEPAPLPPAIDATPLPRASDVKGDLSRNWGSTPTDLRPLFMLMEEVARIPGSARIFAVIAKRESGFVTTAQNKTAAERDASRRGYQNSKGRNPALRFGEQAADFGSGGLFGALAPYFLWTGVPEVGSKAPLLRAPPEIMFQPRVAAFGAAVYLQRLLANYRIDDHADIKAGWASPTLLKDGRGGKTYGDVRARFLGDAKSLGVELTDTTTIPTKLSAAAWPGVPAVFAGLVGALPEDYR